jgi:hypothetical protein
MFRTTGPRQAGVMVTPRNPGTEHSMSTKSKPESTDEAREQARRALQTSMDTRQ